MTNQFKLIAIKIDEQFRTNPKFIAVLLTVPNPEEDKKGDPLFIKVKIPYPAEVIPHGEGDEPEAVEVISLHKELKKIKPGGFLRMESQLKDEEGVYNKDWVVQGTKGNRIELTNPKNSQGIEIEIIANADIHKQNIIKVHENKEEILTLSPAPSILYSAPATRFKTLNFCSFPYSWISKEKLEIFRPFIEFLWKYNEITAKGKKRRPEMDDNINKYIIGVLIEKKSIDVGSHLVGNEIKKIVEEFIRSPFYITYSKTHEEYMRFTFRIKEFFSSCAAEKEEANECVSEKEEATERALRPLRDFERLLSGGCSVMASGMAFVLGVMEDKLCPHSSYIVIETMLNVMASAAVKFNDVISYAKERELKEITETTLSVADFRTKIHEYHENIAQFYAAKKKLAAKNKLGENIDTMKFFLLTEGILSGLQMWSCFVTQRYFWQATENRGRNLQDFYKQLNSDSNETIPTSHLVRKLDVVDNDLDTFLKSFRYEFLEGETKLIGREKNLAEMREILDPDKAENVRLVLAGSQGIGKTQLAEEYLRKFGSQYLDYYYINACSVDKLDQDFERLGGTGNLDLNLKVCNPKEVKDKVMKVLNKKEGWILVYDNADSPEITPSLLETYIPKSKGHVIITSQNSGDWNKATYHMISLSVLSPVDAVTLLAEKIGIDVESNREDLEKIATLLGHYPLALSSASAYIKSYCDNSCKTYLQELKDEGLLPLLDIGKVSDYQKTLDLTLRLPIKIIKKMNMKALDLLYFCSFLAVEGQNVSLLKELMKEGDINLYIEVLKKYSLLEDKGKETYGMHGLVQQIVRGNLRGNLRMKKETMEKETKIREILEQHFFEEFSFDEDDPLTYGSSRDLALHISSYLRTVDEEVSQTETLGFINYKMGKFNIFQKRYEDALKYLEKVLEIQIKELGKDHLDVAGSYIDLGSLSTTIGLSEKALEHYDAALEIQMTMLDKDDLCLADTYNSMANVYHTQEQYDKALEFYEKALHIQKIKLDEYDPCLADTHIGIAKVYEARGTKVYEGRDPFEEALEHYQAALMIQIKKPDEYDPRLADTYSSMASIYCKKNQYDKALEFYKKAIKFLEQTENQDEDIILFATIYHKMEWIYYRLGQIEDKIHCNRKFEILVDRCGDNLNEAKIFSNLWNFYFVQNRYDMAIECCEKALEIYKKRLAKDDPCLAAIYSDVANFYFVQNQYDKAIEFYEKALEIQTKKLDKDDPRLADTYRSMANVYQKVHEEELANEKGVAIETPERCLATTYNGMGNIYGLQGQNEAALKLYKQAIEFEKQRKNLDEDAPPLADTYRSMELICNEQDPYGKALKFYHEALKIISRKPDDESLLAIYSQIAGVYSRQGQYEFALEFYEKARGIITKKLDECNMEDVYLLRLADTLSGMGNIYYQLGQYETALKFLKQALEILTKKVEGDDSRLSKIYHNMGNVFLRQGHDEAASESYKKEFEIFTKKLDNESAVEFYEKELEILTKKSVSLREGARVRIHGLTGKTELNGQIGKVVSGEKEGRVGVQLTGQAKRIGVKRENLTVIQNIQSDTSPVAPEIEGPLRLEAAESSGEGPEAAHVSVGVPVASSEETSLRLGATVRIHGLTGKTELNGKRGEVVSVESNGRFGVKVPNQETISVKRENLTVIQNTQSDTSPVALEIEGQLRLEAAASSGEGSEAAHAPVEPPVASSSEETFLSVGATVRIHGLTGKTELNGKRGEVVSGEKEGRFGVKLPNQETISVKGENLTVIQNTQSDTSPVAPEIEGQLRLEAAALSGEGPEAAHVSVGVPVASSEETSLRLGARVRIDGLTGKTELNGKRGEVVSGEKEGRFCVKLPNQETISVKRENLTVIQNTQSDTSPVAPEIEGQLRLEAAALSGEGPEAAHASVGVPVASSEETSLRLGATVRIHGLTGKTELNGKRGEVVSGEKEGRFGVKLPNQETISVKGENLTVIQNTQSDTSPVAPEIEGPCSYLQ